MTTTCVKPLRALIGALALMATVASTTAADTTYVSQPGTKVKMDGTSSIHDWTVESLIIGGNMTLGFDVKNPPAPGVVPAKVAVRIPYRTLKSGKPVMDQIMMKSLKSPPNNQIEYKLAELTYKEKAGNVLKFDSKGDLTVSGVTKAITMPVTMEPMDGGKLKVNCNTAVKMSEFKIDPPNPKIGPSEITTGDEVKLTIEWMTAPGAAR